MSSPHYIGPGFWKVLPVPPCGDSGTPTRQNGRMTVALTLPIATRDRLQQLAAADGLTLAQEIGELIDLHAPRPKPTVGGFRSGRALTSEEIDEELAKELNRRLDADLRAL